MDNSGGWGCTFALLLIIASFIINYPVLSITLIGAIALICICIYLVKQDILASQKKQLIEDLNAQKTKLNDSKRELIEKRKELNHLLMQNDNLREHCQGIIEKEIARKRNYYELLE